MDDLYYKADACVVEDNFEEAIPLFVQSIKNGNFESAFRLATIYLDCFEELGLNSPDYINAIKYLQIGAFNGHKECQRELGKIFLTNEEYLDLPIGIKWSLASESFESTSKVECIIKAMHIVFKNTDISSVSKLKKTISYFNDYIKLTRNKKILTPCYTLRNELICICAKLVIDNADTVETLIAESEYFTRYASKDFFIDSASSFGAKEICLFLENCHDVHEAENFCMSFNSRYFIYTNDSKGSIYLWLARSYFSGLNNAIADLNTAIQYYLKANTLSALRELNDVSINLCNKFIGLNMYESAKIYSECIQSKNEKTKIIEIVDEHEKKIHFDKIYSDALNGDVDAALELAKLYENGIGTEINFQKALKIYQDIYKKYKNKTSFDFLFNYYAGFEDKTNLMSLLKNAVKHNISLDRHQKDIYKLLFKSYATPSYTKVSTKDLTTIDTRSNIIYYLFEYYKKWWVDKYPDNTYIQRNYQAFIAVKDRYYNRHYHILNFPDAIYNFLKLFNGKWLICTAPGHEKTLNTSNGVYDVLKLVNLQDNFTIRNTIIQRITSVKKKATSSDGRNNDYREDMKSLAIEKDFDVSNKCIIIIDDITTSGSTLIACRNILMDAGAKEVVLLALGKTKETKHEFK